MVEDEYVQLNVGDKFEISVARNMRPARVLAVFGPEALIEYRMPGGSSALRIVMRNQRPGSDLGRPYRNITYDGLRKSGKRFLVQMARDNVKWAADPQRGKDYGTPRGMFLALWPDEKWRLEE